MISYLEALEIILSALPAPRKQMRKLVESSGYFLAEDVISPLDLPEFDNSAMDGYALRSHDTHTATEDNPVQLRIVGEALAGHTFNSKVGKNCAVYIATGAGIPVGTDAVIPVEEIRRAGSEAIGVASPVKKYNHIRFRGEELRKGTTVFAAGDRITPAHTGLLATFGMIEITVYRKPHISFLATGDELVPPEKQPGPGQIRNSNAYIIRSLTKQLGCTFHDLGIARDTEKDILDKLDFDDRPDILITSAGVSAGIDMALQLVSILSDEATARSVQLGIEYDPEPPFGPIKWGEVDRNQLLPYLRGQIKTHLSDKKSLIVRLRDL